MPAVDRGGRSGSVNVNVTCSFPAVGFKEVATTVGVAAADDEIARPKRSTQANAESLNLFTDKCCRVMMVPSILFSDS